jgi:hypothetical protein
MLDLATVSRVPAEFTGQARVFRDQVRAVDLAMDAALAMITEPLRARLGRHPKLRNEMVADTARLYSMLVPPQFRLGAVEATRHRTEFAIVERRIAVSWLRHDEWTDPEHREPGVSVCRFVLAMTDGKLLWRLHPQAQCQPARIGTPHRAWTRARSYGATARPGCASRCRRGRRPGRYR